MLSYWVALLILLGGMWFEADSALAHDPDAPELEVPEVTVIGERPVAASSQQFIPDKEYSAAAARPTGSGAAADPRLHRRGTFRRCR